jgi:tetratricopeptide (TPR) repeat protein
MGSVTQRCASRGVVPDWTREEGRGGRPQEAATGAVRGARGSRYLCRGEAAVRAGAGRGGGVGSHYQHIWAQAALRETEPAIALYSERLARSPTDVREHRFLANAYLAARDYQEAARVVDAGLALAPDDSMLLDVRGDARAATGDPDGALADWRRTVEVDAENLARSTAARCCSSAWDGSRRPRPRGSPSSPGATRTRPH